MDADTDNLIMTGFISDPGSSAVNFHVGVKRFGVDKRIVCIRGEFHG
jgi:hypothetical protein